MRSCGRFGPASEGVTLAEIEFERVRVNRIRALGREEDSLLLRVRLDQRDQIGGTVRHPQIIERLIVDGEEPDGRAILGRHVGDGGAVGQTESADAGAVELDETADHAFGAKHLRDRQDQIRGGRAFAELALQLETDNRRQQHRDRLPKHAGLCFDTAHAPTDDPKTVDHRGVRVGAHYRVGIGLHDPVTQSYS